MTSQYVLHIHLYTQKFGNRLANMYYTYIYILKNNMYYTYIYILKNNMYYTYIYILKNLSLRGNYFVSLSNGAPMFWWHYNPSKHQELFTKQCTKISQKTWAFNTTTVRTSKSSISVLIVGLLIYCGMWMNTFWSLKSCW